MRTFFKEKQLIKRINNLEKTNEVSIDGARSMAESFGEIGKTFLLIDDDPEAAALGATWQKIGEFWSSLQDDRDKADRALTKYVNTPFLVVQQDLTEAEAAKKDHDRTVTAYANAKAKVAKIKGAKKLDQTKLHEAEKEEQDAKENFESSVDETAVAFKKLLGNDQKYLTEELCMGYLDAMEKYLLAGQEKVNELVDELNQIRPGLADASKQSEPHSMKTVDIKGYTDKMRKTLVSLQKEKEKEKDMDKEISDPVERRYRALQNLQKLEQNYLARLALILDNKNAVGYGCSKDPKLAEKVTEADRQAIFYQIPQIHSLHTTALKEHPRECLGRELLSTVDKWQCYTMFAFSHYAAEDTLEKKMEHNADDASQDYRHLQAVIRAIKEIEKELDASNDFSAEMRRLIVIQNSLSGFEGNLVEPARRLLREATFPMIAPLAPGEDGASSSWMGGSTDGRATFRFWLFNDCIVFATESGTSSAGQALRFLNVTSAASNKLKFAGRFSLQGLRMDDLEDTASLYNAFQIIPSSTSPAASLVPTISGRDEPRYTLILPTFADKKDWLTELQNAIDRISKYKVFGVPLDRLMKNNPREKGRTVPYLVDVCTEFLFTKSVAVQGLFRESGSGAEIEKKKVLVDLGNELVLPASENDHNVTGLLKMWIRDLPDPLLTYGHYPEWIELGNRVVGEKESGGNMARLLPQVQKLILALPETNRYVMQVLFKLLSCVAQHKESNLMSPSNLAIVFSPILLVNRAASPFDTSDFKASNAIITIMIDYYEPIFSEIEKEREAKEKQRTASQ
ncbi:RhoGAP domain containing protein [Acanthamoeba castellanii str. Neff]|uniref:RhoGAP domain containing protein n=1 Tax=Acanthamoeba castellanii (strain ATCC 30010 / Neff) TaxID=1257118 RepID=L8GD04_ACACF|nr:RhoGAP domain containing protein [Acanthamoeba castellanii str. Neff]ELR11035.1 RhoGAP domain containing protein [Acanthamoeba castellanii str. Neff]